MTSFQETPETKIMLTELSKILDRKQSDVIRKAIEFYYNQLTQKTKLKPKQIMKTQIKITGQPNGNQTLRSQIAASFSQLMFNNFISEEMTKKEARMLLKDAYKSLKSESNVSFNGDNLSYDASQANIICS